VKNSDTSSRYAAALVGGFADVGVEFAIVSPGSRNTPITLALANEPRIRDISIRDERTAGFMALGYAKMSQRPAIVLCTSGSAATHYFPAIAEADQSATPMIVLTADRPQRLRGTGAPQTMDQIELFGSHVKTFQDLDAFEVDSARADAISLVGFATSGPPGPVHANVPLDEPLLPSAPIPAARKDPSAAGATSLDASESPHLLHVEERSVLIIAGGRRTIEQNGAILELSRRLTAPVLADAQTNLTGDNVLTHGDLIVGVRDDRGSVAMAAQPPDIVIRIGPVPTSQHMWRWLESSKVDQILIDESRLSDPLGSARRTYRGDVATSLNGIRSNGSRDSLYLESWLAMDRIVDGALEDAMLLLPFPNEPQVARSVVASVPPRTGLVVASSRPIRDVDTFATPRPDVDIVANRGLNGIDGTISTALGVTTAGMPTTLLIGDVAALHDIGCLAEVAGLDADLRIIVVNNNGGGIFSFLPQARSEIVDSDVYERHWGTPHGLDLASIATSMGISASRLDSRAGLEAAVAAPIEGPELFEVVTHRSAILDHDTSIRQTVSEALISWLAGG